MVLTANVGQINIPIFQEQNSFLPLSHEGGPLKLKKIKINCKELRKLATLDSVKGPTHWLVYPHWYSTVTELTGTSPGLNVN